MTMNHPASGKSRKVLVLGDDTRAFLSTVRSLGRGGLEVHIAWCGKESIARRSRYVYRAHEIPPYDTSNDQWKTALRDLMESNCFDLVIPCSDPTILPIQKHRKEFEPSGPIYLLDDDIQAIVGDKLRTAELARSVGVNVPRERILSVGECGRDLARDFTLPVVLKPTASFDPDRVGDKRFVRKAYSWDEYDKLVQEMMTEGPVAVQENFIGMGVGVELLLRDGEILTAFQHARVHEPLHGGGSSYRRSVPVSPGLLDASARMMRELQYTGVAMVEFKVDRQTNDWVLIEVNGRFWGSLPLAVAAGADFPLWLYQLIVEGRTCFPNRHRVGIYSRNLALDLHWQAANLRADRSNPTLSTRPVIADLWESAANVLTSREHSDTLVLDDPLPGAIELRDLAGKAVHGLIRAVAVRYLQLRPVRRRLAARARRALREADTVVFVCKGNICRSPFAEGIARAIMPDKTVLSAGTYKTAGRPSPPTAVEAALRWSVDLAPHRSRVLDRAIVDEASAIFVFDYENFVRVHRAYPFAKDRIHLVGALRPDHDLFIADPWGGDRGRFDASNLQIAEALQAR